MDKSSKTLPPFDVRSLYPPPLPRLPGLGTSNGPLTSDSAQPKSKPTAPLAREYSREILQMLRELPSSLQSQYYPVLAQTYSSGKAAPGYEDAAAAVNEAWDKHVTEKQLRQQEAATEKARAIVQRQRQDYDELEAAVGAYLRRR